MSGAKQIRMMFMVVVIVIAALGLPPLAMAQADVQIGPPYVGPDAQGDFFCFEDGAPGSGTQRVFQCSPSSEAFECVVIQGLIGTFSPCFLVERSALTPFFVCPGEQQSETLRSPRQQDGAAKGEAVPVPITQEGEQESEAGEIDQSFDVS